MEKRTTNVLVIGGGLAAMMAALEASALSLPVLMVSKGKIGKSGATLMAGSNFAAVLPDGQAEGDSKKLHIEDTLSGGGEINDLRLVRTMVENAPRDLLLLEELGVAFLKREGHFELRKPPGHRYPRTVFTSNPGIPIKIRGKTITDPLLKAVHQRGIGCLDGVSIVRLVVADGFLVGAVAIDRKSGELLAIECKAAVMAAGGAGALYEIHTNPNDLTGDSYSLALEAGCPLRDIEFVQFFPTVHLGSPRVTLYSPLLGDGAVLRNKTGERFLEKYEPQRMELATRDTVSRAIYREIQEGRAVEGGVYLDLTSIPRDLLSFRFPDLLQLFERHGIDLRKDWIHVAPAAHFFMGGVVINERCQTFVPGLFAAGEGTGGVHGANRLSGNGLSDPLVFGRIAGREAGLYCQEHRNVAVREKAFSIDSSFRGQGVSEGEIEETRKRIKRLMGESVGIVRNRAGLTEALEELESLQVHFEPRSPSKERISDYFEVRSMFIAAIAVTKAALFREESRGAHFREDFPEPRREMAKSILVNLNRGEMRPSFMENQSGSAGSGMDRKSM